MHRFSPAIIINPLQTIADTNNGCHIATITIGIPSTHRNDGDGI